jgi:hypothetical protein
LKLQSQIHSRLSGPLVLVPLSLRGALLSDSTRNTLCPAPSTPMHPLPPPQPPSMDPNIEAPLFPLGGAAIGNGFTGEHDRAPPPPRPCPRPSKISIEITVRGCKSLRLGAFPLLSGCAALPGGARHSPSILLSPRNLAFPPDDNSPPRPPALSWFCHAPQTPWPRRRCRLRWRGPWASSTPARGQRQRRCSSRCAGHAAHARPADGLCRRPSASARVQAAAPCGGRGSLHGRGPGFIGMRRRCLHHRTFTLQ